MAFILDFGKLHPILSASTLVAGGAVGYGVSHKLLDFEAPYAVGAGVATGVSLLSLEAYLYSMIPDVRKIVIDAADDVAEGVQAVVDSAAEVVPMVGEVSGTTDTAVFDPMSGVQQSGRHQLDTDEEKEAMGRFVTANLQKNGPAAAQAYRDLQAAQAKAHGSKAQDDDPGADANFPTNKENAAPVFDINAHGAPDNDEERKAFGAILFASDKQAAYQRYISVAMQQHMAPSTTA